MKNYAPARPTRMKLIRFCFALLAGMTVGAAAQQPGQMPESPETIPLSEFMDLTPLAVTEDVQELVSTVLTQQPDSGASAYVSERQVEYLSLQDAIMRSLEKNLSISVSTAERERVEQVLNEAKAVFEPVFDISTTYDRSDTSERLIFGTVIEKAFQPKSPLAIPINPKKAAQGIPQVNEIGFRKQVRQEVDKLVEASPDQRNGPDKVWNTSVSVSQQLPWGPVMAITTVLTNDDVYYDRVGHTYNKDWTASLALNLAIPLPYSRNFGPYAPQDVAVRLAVKDSERSYWDLKAVVNSILATTDLAYWNTVARLEDLKVVHENVKAISAQAESTARQFDLGLVTRFGKAQVDAELARVKALEESARRSLIAASNRLATLITDTGDEVSGSLYLPIDYARHLNKELDLESADAFAIAEEYRPELQASRISVEAGEISREFARVQTRPDVNFFGSLSVDQEGDPVGYDSPTQALSNITSPDSRSWNAGLNFRRPWGNRALEAAYAGATARYSDLELGLRDLENVVEQNVGDALAGVYTARQRIKIAEKNVALAEDAYERLLRRRKTAGDVTELEVVLNSRRVLEARAQRIAALVDHKVAETQLLTAQGIIANQYGHQLASSNFEIHRIDLLAKNDAVHFFAPVSP